MNSKKSKFKEQTSPIIQDKKKNQVSLLMCLFEFISWSSFFLYTEIQTTPLSLSLLNLQRFNVVNNHYFKENCRLVRE